MATHAHGPGDPVSVAKIGLYGTIAAAIIGAVTTVLVGVLARDNVSEVSKDSAPPASTSPNGPHSDARLRFSPIVNGKLTVSGSAQKDVEGMWAFIGPKSAGGFDVGCGDVVNQQWQAEVATDASWQKYQFQTVPAYDSSCPATGTVAGVKFTFKVPDPTTSPSPGSADLVDCAEKLGPQCFNGPGFGPPTMVHPPNQ